MQHFNSVTCKTQKVCNIKIIQEVNILFIFVYRFRYFGDFQRPDLEDPRKRYTFWKIANRTIQNQKKKIQNLQRKNRQMINKIHSMKALTRHLRQENLITENAQLMLNVSAKHLNLLHSTLPSFIILYDITFF